MTYIKGRESPYKGLMPYEEEDAKFFFGRDKDINIIFSNLRAYRFTVLYGPSGVGKSSVLRAGVLHKINQRIKEELEDSTIPEFIPVLFSTWHGKPLKRLKEHIEHTIKGVIGQAEEKSILSVNSFSPKELTNLSLVDCIKTFTEKENFKTELLIILDQFEEYFLYHPHGDDFLQEFPKAVNHPNLRVNFLIGLREDGLAKLDLFKGRIPTLFNNYLRLKNLNHDAAYEAITKPIEQFNKLLPKGEPPFSIEKLVVGGLEKDSFVSTIIEEVESGQITLEGAGKGQLKKNYDAGSEDKTQIETPYLQLVMTRLWSEELAANSRIIRFITFQRLGGADGIAKSHLDKTMEALPPKERALCAKFFHYLVTPSGAKIAYGPLDLAHYLKLKATTPEERVEKIKPVLDKLSSGKMRILRPTEGGKYEIFHDALAKAILDWKLRREQKRNRRIRRITINFSGVLLVIVILLLILIPNILAARNRANDTVAQTYLRNAVTFQEVYSVDNNTYTSSDKDLKSLGLTEPPTGITFIVESGASNIDYCMTATHKSGSGKMFAATPSQGIFTGTCSD